MSRQLEIRCDRCNERIYHMFATEIDADTSYDRREHFDLCNTCHIQFSRWVKNGYEFEIVHSDELRDLRKAAEWGNKE